jgi:quinoprotein glucose dehydrogenase
VDIGKRRTREELKTLINEGGGRMPAFDYLGKNVDEIVDFLITGKDAGHVDVEAAAKDPNWLQYRNEGYILFRDPDGYPPLTPPWGTLNAIDLNKGEIRWHIPLGEYPELVAQGITNTGSDNYGGPVVTSSGLLFIAATNFDKKFRAFDKLTGQLLWETVLPAAGNATPSIYELNGREYIVIVCGGGKNGAPSGSSIVAFALPN